MIFSFDHIHKPRSYTTYNCKTCGERLVWDGEWGEWLSEWEQFQLSESDPDWLYHLLRQRSNNATVCVKNIIYFEADVLNAQFKKAGKERQKDLSA